MIGRPLGALVATALLAGCNGAHDSTNAQRAGLVTTPKPTAVTTAISRGTPDQRRLLRSIVARMTPTIVYGISIEPPHPPWTPYKPHSVLVRIAYRPFRQRGRGEWEAALIGQAFATQSRLLGLAPVTGYQSPTQGVALDGPNPPEPDTRKKITRRELAESVRAAAQSSGAEVIRLRTIEPMNFAAAVTLRVNRPASYLRHRLENFLSSLPNAGKERFDGLYIRIVDRGGRFVWFSAATNGESVSGWNSGARRDLRGCDPTPTFGWSPGKAAPPPCPEG